MPRVLAGVDALRDLVGRDAVVGEWWEVTQQHIDGFAAATGDRQWIHCDPVQAQAKSPYGTTIAHGFYTLALLSKFLTTSIEVEGCGQIINYGLNRLRFPAPVRVGSRVRGHFTLQAVEDVGEGVQVTWLATVEVEGQPKPALVAEWLLRYGKVTRSV
jgi:acyl dehydratase